MSGEPKKQYKANYRVPPEASRWTKGKSGNPAGRPKDRPSETDTGKILLAVGNEIVETSVGGKPRSMRREEFRVLKLITMAIDGDLAAAEQIEKMARHHLQLEEKGASGYRFAVMPDYYFNRANKEMSASQCREVEKKLKRIQSEANEPELISEAYMFRRIVQEEVPIDINGKKVKVTRWQLYLRKIYASALSGDNRASKLLFRLQKQYPAGAPSGPVTTYLITKADENL